MKPNMYFISLIAVLVLGVGCTPKIKNTEVAFDPDDFPPIQRCNERFRQKGKASKQVTSCSNVQPQTLSSLLLPAKADADSKAALRCPSLCPAEHLSWQGNQRTCNNKTLTLIRTGNYRCPSKQPLE